MSEVSPVKQNAVFEDEFLVSIKASWNKAVSSILETAQTLKEAEEQLPRRDFLGLKKQLQQNRIMSKSTITKLIKIGSNEVLTAPENMALLPASYSTLYEITQYEPSDIQSALSDGKLSSATLRQEVKDALPPRERKKITAVPKTARVSIFIRFSADEGVIPQTLLLNLQKVLSEIEAYTDVKTSGGIEE
jgi:hypothetical protein